jgi:hypothetical protein
MLAHVSRLLEPGGEVWVSCPNAKSALRTLFGRWWINWHVPFHIAHFSEGRLTSLLRERGFLVFERRQLTPSLWAASSVVSALFARHGKTTVQLRNPVLMMGLMFMFRCSLFPLAWAANSCGRGDSLILRARLADK